MSQATTGSRAGQSGLRTASGGRIDRAQRLRFIFDGQSYEGLAGDTLASALLANGVHLIGRSFKYHRPRGIWPPVGGTDALVTVSRDVARVTPICARLKSSCMRPDRREPKPLAKLETRLRPHQRCLVVVFPGGFYYKTFMWPRKAWKALYEP